jgi:hypothetical protein
LQKKNIHIKWFKSTDELDDFFDTFPIDIPINQFRHNHKDMKYRMVYVYMSSELFKYYAKSLFGYIDKRYNKFIIPYSRPADFDVPYYMMTEEKSFAKDMVVITPKYINILHYLRKYKLKRLLQ